MKPRAPCEFCGQVRRHETECPAPYVRSLIRTLSKAPDSVLALAVPRLSERHQKRLREALAGEGREE